MQYLLPKDTLLITIDKCDTETAVGFKDGSCLGNRGPCGAGACLFVSGFVDHILLKQPVSNIGSISLGELVAIKLALKHIYQYKMERQIHVDIKKIHICTIARVL